MRNISKFTLKMQALLGSLLLVTVLVGCSNESSSSDKFSDVQSQGVIEGEGSHESSNSNLEDAETFELRESANISELDELMLNSINLLSNKQNINIEASSVSELEQLSEVDRQSLQAKTAEQTMIAAEELASKQVEGSTFIKAEE